MSTVDGLFIGLMSGTSLDGIDAALVDCRSNQIQLVATASTELSDTLRNDILDLCQPGANELVRAGKLHLTLGQAFAAATNTLLHQENINAKDIRAIGSHGQTVRHHPSLGFSLQLGSGDIIANHTGITTIVDFRNHDMTLGGQGAPLVPPFHQAIFSTPERKRAVVNIGGMANVSLLDGNNLAAGFDTGPGNVLLNHWAETHLHRAYDHNGEFAASGNILPPLLQRLLNDRFFQQQGPKSTGREHFNARWLAGHLNGSEHPADVQATLTALTAVSIADALTDFSPDEVYLCGGGAHNGHLLRQIASRLPASQVSSTSTLGWHPDWIEAACFAWLAWARLNHLPATSPLVTGASRACISGAIYVP